MSSCMPDAVCLIFVFLAFITSFFGIQEAEICDLNVFIVRFPVQDEKSRVELDPGCIRSLLM